MRDYHVFEMENMETYPKDLGVAFALEDVKWASKQLWAPDCVEKDGKYYYVFPARDKNKMFRLGIAIADNPAGPFTPEPDYIKGSYSMILACFLILMVNIMYVLVVYGDAILINIEIIYGVLIIESL